MRRAFIAAMLGGVLTLVLLSIALYQNQQALDLANRIVALERNTNDRIKEDKRVEQEEEARAAERARRAVDQVALMAEANTARILEQIERLRRSGVRCRS